MAATTAGSEPDRAEHSLEASGLCVTVGDHLKLLDDVCFRLESATLLAVLGPSGSGKTTLLNALTGFRPADEGTVFYAGRDLYDEYDELRFEIGYVPQENVLHDQLRVGQALRFAAALRFPEDVPKSERDARVREVIEEMELTERVETRISSLSGGQRKRVNVALELLTRPALLFLDEPTSGLDPGNEREMMELLRTLATRGRIVIVVTHSAQSLDLCDRVLFLGRGGKLAYFGEPDAALEYFGQAPGAGAYAAAFSSLEERKDVDWKARFEASPLFEKYVKPDDALAAAGREREAHQPLPPRPRHSLRHQTLVLIRRQLALLAAEPRALALLVAQAPLLGLLYFLVFGPNSLSTRHGDDATLIVWLLAVGATWLGVGNSIREIVKELPVYRRERSIGLAIGPYLGSKAILLGLLTVVQAAALVLIGLAHQQLPPADREGYVPFLRELGYAPGDYARGSVFSSQWLELIVAIALTGIAAVALGLFISTLVKSSNQALALLPLVLAVQIVLSLPLFAGSISDTLGKVTSARWGTDAAGSTVSLNVLRAPLQLALVQGRSDVQYDVDYLEHQNAAVYKPPPAADIKRALRGQPRWDHRAHAWWLSIVVTSALAAVFFAGAWVVLRVGDLRVLAEQLRKPARAPPEPVPTSPRVVPAIGRMSSLRLKPHRRLFALRHVVALLLVVAAVGAGIAVAARSDNGRAAPYPNANEQRLLGFVRPEVGETCVRRSIDVPSQVDAAIICRVPSNSNVQVIFYRFTGVPPLTRWYAGRVSGKRPAEAAQGCVDTRFPGERPYTIGGRSGDQGRLLCVIGSVPEIDWINVPDLVGAVAVDNSGDEFGLFREWRCCLGG